MRKRIVFILLSLISFTQLYSIETAEKKYVRGIVLYKYSPDKNYKNYYCRVDTKILIDSVSYDFIPNNSVNYSIISKYKELENQIGNVVDFPTENIETSVCVFYPNDKRFSSHDKDSILSFYKENNIYDSLIYKPDLEESTTLRIKSNSIYIDEKSDTVFIAFRFYGNVIVYENLYFTEKYEKTDVSLKNSIDNFVSADCSCPKTKHNFKYIVLNKVEKLDKISDTELNILKLKLSKQKDVKQFLYE